jgi:hypothetical protein
MRLTVLGLSLLVAACGSLFGPETVRVIGTIEHFGDEAVVVVPTAVGVGEPFTVVVQTVGGGCVSRGHAEVTVDGMRAAITPYDIRTLRAVCPSDIAFFEHTATVRFDAAGTAEVVVQGLRQPGDEPVSVRQTVIVRGPAGGEAAGWSHGH